jgi:hypothetical protein
MRGTFGSESRRFDSLTQRAWCIGRECARSPSRRARSEPALVPNPTVQPASSRSSRALVMGVRVVSDCRVAAAGTIGPTTRSTATESARAETPPDDPDLDRKSARFRGNIAARAFRIRTGDAKGPGQPAPLRALVSIARSGGSDSGPFPRRAPSPSRPIDQRWRRRLRRFKRKAPAPSATPGAGSGR